MFTHRDVKAMKGGQGIKVYQNTLTINPKTIETIFNYPRGVSIVVEIAEFANSKVENSTDAMNIFLFPRDENGEISEEIGHNLPSKDGSGSVRLSPKAIKDNGCSFMDILHYDTNEGAFKVALRNLFYMPNGGILRLVNNMNQSDDFSYLVVVRELD